MGSTSPSGGLGVSWYMGSNTGLPGSTVSGTAKFKNYIKQDTEQTPERNIYTYYMCAELRYT